MPAPVISSTGKSVLILLLILYSCQNIDKKDHIITLETKESLEWSNMKIKEYTTDVLKHLEEKSIKPATSEKALILLSKAKYIQSKIFTLVQFIESIENELEQKAGQDSKLVKHGGNSLVEELLIKQKKGADLYKKISDCRTDLLKEDSSFLKIYNGELILIANMDFQNLYTDEQSFTNVHFKNTSYLKAINSLLKFKSDAIVTENNLVVFLNNNLTNHIVLYDDFPSILANQNATHFKAGDELVIKAGIGSYDVAYTDKILINGIQVEKENGTGTFKMKIRDKPGRYQVPIKIEIIGADTKRGTFSEIVEYTVEE
ncbi:MAG: hypothetical protein QM791_13690 [Ferruginibacter sp.]